MMRGAPKRWLDDGGSGLASERDVLRGGLNVEPPPGEKDAVWAAIIAGLPPPGGGGGGGASGKALAAKGVGGAAKAASLAAGGVVKGLIVGVSAAALLAGAYFGLASRAPSAKLAPNATAVSGDERPALDGTPFPSLTVEAVTAPHDTAPREAQPATGEPPRSANAADARPTSPATPIAPATAAASDPTLRQTQMKEASEAISSAHSALRGGDAPGALAQLEAMRGRFPPGMLAEEREVLTIEALAQSGQRAQAKARAEAFLRAAPNTIYASRVEPYTR